MTAIPYWALSLAYWLHMLATVVWIGGLTALTLFVLPSAQKALDPSSFASFLDDLQRRIDPLGWFSLAILIGTGMIQMSANTHYQGFLEIEGRWAIVMLAKHLMFLIMIAVSAYLTWGLLPKLRRATLMRTKGATTPNHGELYKKERALLRINLILGIVILALTAVARTT